MLPLLDHGNTRANTGIYLVSKRLKLGSTPIADVDFFPRQPSLPTPPTQSATGGDQEETAVGGGGGSSDGAVDGRLDSVSTMCGSGSGSNSGSGSGSNGGVPGNDVALVFGNEVDGLSALDEGPQGRSLPAVYLPMRDDVIRSYNLSNAVSGRYNTTAEPVMLQLESRGYRQTGSRAREVARSLYIRRASGACSRYRWSLSVSRPLSPVSVLGPCDASLSPFVALPTRFVRRVPCVVRTVRWRWRCMRSTGSGGKAEGETGL